MPSGIILSSGSQGATKEDIEKVLAANGYEADKPEAEAEVIEAPKREDFKTDAEFEAAEEAHAEKLEEQEEAEAEREAEEERKRLEALPKKTRKQRAVEKATKELNERLRKAEEKLAALEGKGAGEGKQKPAAKAELKAPKEEDFKTPEEFEDAMFDYRYKLRRAKEEAEAAKTSLNARLEQNFNDYKTAVLTFKDEHDDWDEVVDQSIAIPEAVYYAVVDLGKEGPAVTYYLGQHPEVLEELAELTPYRAAAEVGRLAEKLNPKAARKAAAGAGEKPKPKPRTSIPEPVRPVSTSATTSTTTSREAAKARDYRAFKAAQRRGA